MYLEVVKLLVEAGAHIYMLDKVKDDSFLQSVLKELQMITTILLFTIHPLFDDTIVLEFQDCTRPCDQVWTDVSS